ncbi:hypothetical protein [Methylotetracoccus oryzae]|uniref:hypothetical protein n=1 Tax=Methylotetracoccus oryzae TaxID=1919059 RepID=UPI0013A584EC|nr:hypothetical protein [Methylotetracoccus oryzae]
MRERRGNPAVVCGSGGFEDLGVLVNLLDERLPDRRGRTLICCERSLQIAGA